MDSFKIIFLKGFLTIVSILAVPSAVWAWSGKVVGISDGDTDGWRNRMTKEDWCGLTPLFYLHINPDVEFSLDMNTRIGIDEAIAA